MRPSFSRLAVAGAETGERLYDVVTRGRRFLDRQLARLPEAAAEEILDWNITELMLIHDWVFLRGWLRATDAVERIHVVTDWDEVKTVAELTTEADRTHFVAHFREGFTEMARTPKLRVILAGGRVSILEDLAARATADDPYHRLHRHFFTSLREQAREKGGRCLEIGSRNRSGEIRRDWVAPMDYVGVDITDGENVDVVADAHSLSTHFPAESFDAAFTISTFEHLAMPWKVALELNKVLRVGARALIASHQTYPLHEEPWDFWRFSASAWRTLFNEATGFRVIDVAYGEPGRVISTVAHGTTDGIERKPAWLGCAVVIEKSGPTELRWPVETATASAGRYPV